MNLVTEHTTIFGSRSNNRSEALLMNLTIMRRLHMSLSQKILGFDFILNSALSPFLLQVNQLLVLVVGGEKDYYVKKGDRGNMETRKWFVERTTNLF